MKAVLTEEDSVRQTVSEISSLCKNNDNKVHYGEIAQSTSMTKETELDSTLLTVT